MNTPFLLRQADQPCFRHEPAHPNPARGDWTAGQGVALSRWLLGQPEAMRDARLHALLHSELAPQAAIGWHAHTHDAELYLLLEGSLRIRLAPASGEAQELELAPGDCHHLPRGHAHAAQAGLQGAKFVVLIWSGSA